VSYADAIDYLNSRIKFGIRPGTERVRAVCEDLARPQDAYPLIHISGTNAKFSVLAIATAILTEIGMTVGTYTSPDLGNVRERIGFALEPIDEQTFEDVLGYLRPYIELVEERLGEQLTYFELLTVMAFEAFFDRAVHAAVIEAGLGGEFDATNVADGVVGVLTNVSLDHIRQFGGDLSKAAWEKAGIAKPGQTFITGIQQDDLFELVSNRAMEKGASSVARLGRDIDLLSSEPAVGGQVVRVEALKTTYDELFIPLFGAGQARNTVLAISACEAFVGEELDRDTLQQGLANVKLPARMEIMRRRPLVIVDGGHNPGASSSVREALEDSFTWQRLFLVVGMVDTKPIDESLRIWAPIVDHAIVTTPRSERIGDPQRLADVLTSNGVETEIIGDVGQAVEHAIALADAEDLVMVFGSFYTATEARDWLRAHN
jgi:dihydrofolate synthase/folylpolyglutamate synthase